MRGAGVVAGTALLAVGAAACDDGTATTRQASVRISVAPDHGTKRVRPDRPVQVRVNTGRLREVQVTSGGVRLEGELSRDGKHWKSRWNLRPGTRYAVRASAVGADGKARTITSSFRTRKVPGSVQAAVIAPLPGEEVGVGMPIIVRFDRPVSRKREVERALEVRASQPVEGAWRWFGDQEVVFRTRKFWPAHTNVRLTSHLSGLRVAPGAYGTRDTALSFRVGDARISTARARKHYQVVTKNGERIRRLPISMGKATTLRYTTTSGTHVIMGKDRSVVFDSSTVGCPKGCLDYYRRLVHWAVKFSGSGEYVHSAPWARSSLGKTNISHGCVNLRPRHARWFFRFSRRGDVLEVKGTRRQLEPANGWSYWQIPWRAWPNG